MNAPVWSQDNGKISLLVLSELENNSSVSEYDKQQQKPVFN